MSLISCGQGERNPAHPVTVTTLFSEQFISVPESVSNFILTGMTQRGEAL